MTNQLVEDGDSQVWVSAIEAFWASGRAEDLLAIDTACEQHPSRPLPEFLRGPKGVRFCVAPNSKDAEQVAALLDGQYWTQGISRHELRDAQLGSNVWVVARDSKTGEVVASARALSDGARLAYVLDVIVHPDLRGSGVGKGLMRVLLSHPRVRSVRGLRLRTRDAQAFYRGLGFFTRDEGNDEMVRLGAG